MADIEQLIAGKRCLVLDDEVFIALDVQQILEGAGAIVVTRVSNAADALAALRSASFDFAVLDVKLSDSTRTSLTIAAMLAEEKTPFVFLTGMGADGEHIRQFPGAPVVEKPYQASTLMEAIARAISRVG